MEGTISYMINNLMCHPPIVLQNVVILSSRREGQFLRYWLITNHHQFKARLLACLLFAFLAFSSQRSLLLGKGFMHNPIFNFHTHSPENQKL